MDNVSTMRHLRIVLVRTRFPENIGMAARAAANMGIGDLVLVSPERWGREIATPLATGKGLEVLENIRIVPTLSDALAGCCRAFGATARTGGWRQQIMTPSAAATAIMETLAKNDSACSLALVFGPEDRGLENTEIERCTDLVTIPTAPGASSLNLAQSVLILAYECFIRSLDQACHPAHSLRKGKHSRAATVEEQELFFATLQRILEVIEFLPRDNPEWFMQPLRRFFHRARIKRHEFDIFMGICRKLTRNIGKAE